MEKPKENIDVLGIDTDLKRGKVFDVGMRDDKDNQKWSLKSIDLSNG